MSQDEKREPFKRKTVEALEFYQELKERGLKPFDGASVVFRRRRNIVFIPRKPVFEKHGEGVLSYWRVLIPGPLITVVKKEELLKLLVANDIHRVLVDALPSRALLQSLLEQGIEVYALRRPSALAGFKAMLLRRYDIQIPRKSVFMDAVALAFTKTRFHRRILLLGSSSRGRGRMPGLHLPPGRRGRK